jgi:hypothetical protein
VVLEEAGQMILEVEAGEEVLADRAGVALFQAVVEPLVVGVVEALLLEGPLEVPVDLGEEEEARDLGADGLGGLGQKAGAEIPQVLRKTSGRTSMAMSQRTPSHWRAIRRSSASMAS